MEDSDIGERMNTIKHAVDYFISCFYKVCHIIEESGAKNNVVEISSSEIAGYADVLREEFRAAKFKKDKKDEDKAIKEGKDSK